MPRRRILIVGGSTRAAADSVRRAGWQPICADMFADIDLRQSAEVIPVRSYPESLPEDVAHVEADGWFYCGALENHPKILKRMISASARYGPLLGSDPDAVSRVRDPRWLAQTLLAAQIPALEVINEGSAPDPDENWIQKPIASAGGRSVRIWDRSAAANPLREPHYFQRRVRGGGFSALFRIDAGQIEWLGSCRELEERTGSRAPTQFAYCGSSGPINEIVPSHELIDELSIAAQASAVSAPQTWSSADDLSFDGVRPQSPFTISEQVTRIAKRLADCAPGLRGLVGLDFQLRQESVWLIEVNPRYTASVEVLELASGCSLINPERIQAEGIPAIKTPDAADAGANRPIVMKQILYADRQLTVPDLRQYLPTDDPWRFPFVADIPVPQSVVEPGWPICTVFAFGPIMSVAEACLRDRVAHIRSLLDGLR